MIAQVQALPERSAYHSGRNASYDAFIANCCEGTRTASTVSLLLQRLYETQYLRKDIELWQRADLEFERSDKRAYISIAAPLLATPWLIAYTIDSRSHSAIIMGR
ncbi:hypothetical protein [Paraburkholderia sp. 40]|uniref:hypothetical protein n=1 Tax=Paraburkholderia sp. 40 TaxID=2991059 RepID=UPI003D22B0D7